MTRPIGYYVHHHGDGHRQRALAIAAGNARRIVMLGTALKDRTGEVSAIDLPDDRLSDTGCFDGVDGTPSRPNALHYAPLDHDGVRSRMSLIAGWISAAHPALIVVDVSVEIAMFARLCATAVAFVRLSGRRDDVAHCEAYRAASLLLAPFAQSLDDMTLPQWIRDKTVYCPGIVGRRPSFTDPVPRTVLFVGGKGGLPQDGKRIAAAASATPDYHWRVIGPARPPDLCPENLVFAGWIDDPVAEMAASEIVVGAAGDGLVNAVMATRSLFICCPEQRPFDEQLQKARALQSVGAAVVVERWPDPGQWPGLFADARALDRGRLTMLDDPDGAAKTLRLLEALADGQK